MADGYCEGSGRRKQASARVRLHPGGNGSVLINDKNGADFLPRAGDLDAALAPLRSAGMEGTYNVTVHVNGGGITGQTSPIHLAVTPPLTQIDPQLPPL